MTLLDGTVFAIYLAAAALLGGFLSRGKQSLGEYFLAGRAMNRWIVGLSVLAALFSGISYLAGPSEVYANGFAFAWVLFAFFIATPVTALILLPHFYQSRYFTAYQILEERFSLPVRLLASGMFILRVCLWLAAAMYAPALALEQATGLPLWFTIMATGILTTIYTTAGGMKAVIWTDIMQLAVLFGGQLLISIMAAGKIPHGLVGVWETAVANDRFHLSFHVNLSERITFWGILIGAPVLLLVQMATDQVSVQRYLTAGSLREAQRALWIKLWFFVPIFMVFYGTGLVLYAFYKVKGDPLAAGLITKADQILPYFVVHELPPGIPGLLIAAIFAASMSVVSSGLNSLTSATMMDFWQNISGPAAVEDSKALWRARGVTVFYGILVTLLAFAIRAMPGNLVESVNTIMGLFGGPMLGLFILAMFTKRATPAGAVLGCLAGVVMLLLIFIMRDTWKISFLWYALIGSLVTFVVGLVTSRPSMKPAVQVKNLP